MSFQAQTHVIENSQHKGAALLVLLMIANHAHADGSNAFPSVPTLAKECRMSARQITRIIKKLEASGEIVVDRSAGGHSHRYRIVMPPPPEAKTAPADHDTLTGFSDTGGAQMSPSTLTDRERNPDKSSANPDIAMSPKLTIEPKKNSHENTHTQRARPRVTPPAAHATESAAADVGVEKISRHSLDVRKAHAARNNLGGGWITNSKDGRYDEAIDAELERLSPAAVEAARSAPPDNFMRLGEARSHVRSVRSVSARTNLPELIARLNVAEADREMLLREFVPGALTAGATV